MKSVFSSIVNKGPKIMPELQYKLPTSFITHMDFILLLNKKTSFDAWLNVDHLSSSSQQQKI